ncbi:MAG: hypothetical protein RL129_1196, partial [Actinomycetota bacterium]
MATKPLSFYIHVPYCVKRCGYCDFNTYTPSELNSDLTGVSLGYIDQLIKEVDIAKKRVSNEISTIFIGGGTPTLLEAKDFARLLKKLEETFGFKSNIEITIEANPDSVNFDKLKELRETGINRISFGMQSAVPHVLKVLDRTHNPENVAKAVNDAKAAGFSEINLDLIYGTPTESIEDWQKSIAKRKEFEMPDDGQTADKYLLLDEELTKNGFNWYELSNWAKPGSECQHNIAYWKGHNWWGLGPGSHSHIDGERFWNVKHPNTYKTALETGEQIAGNEILTESEKESERVMLEIRLPAGIKKDSL